jgi:MoxR-like ATPase
MSKKVNHAGNTKLQAMRVALNANLQERGDLVDGILVALLSKENLFVLGPPGTGKSLSCELLCNALGGKFFSWLLGKTTTPDELFGSVSVQGLKNDDYRRVTENKLPSADFAFIDEIFKGSSAILNTLLPVINERKFYNGKNGAEKVPLQFVLAASNEVPQAEELGALYDRFALRYIVDRIGSDDSFKAMVKGSAKNAIPAMTFQEVEQEQIAASEVELPDDVINVICELRRLVNEEGIYVSDRKWNQAIKIVKASARLNGRTEATVDDLEILANVLWSDPNEKKNVSRMVAKVSNPAGEKILEITDAVSEIEKDIKEGKLGAADATGKVKTAIRALEKLGDPETNAKLKSALENVRKVQQRILKEHLGLE